MKEEQPPPPPPQPPPQQPPQNPNDGGGAWAPYVPEVPYAGAYAGAEYGQAEKKKPALPLPPKKLLAIGGCAIAAVIAAIVLISIFKPSKYTKTKNGTFIYSLDGETVFISSKGDRAAFDGSNRNLSSSIDGASAAFAIADEDMQEYTLYYSDGGAPKKVADGENIRFSIAASGKAVAYATWDDGDDSYAESTLYIYSGGKSAKIAGGASAYSFCISPDGKTVAYIGNYDDEDRDFTAYIWNGKSSEAGKNKTPAAVSDGGKYFYYRNRDGVLFAQKGTRDDTKQRLGNGEAQAFNRDLSQVIFDHDGKAYISVKGGERQGLSGRFYNFVAPANTGVAVNDSAVIFGVSSFADTFYVSGSNNMNASTNIVRITGKYGTETVARSIDGGAFLADGGKTLFYIKNNDAYKINGMRSGADGVKLADDVDSLVVAPGGGAIYYIDEDGELFYQKGTGKPKSLGDAESMSYGLFEEKTLYFIEDGELRAATGDKVTSSGFRGIDDDVVSVYAYKYMVIVYTDDYSSYASFDGKRFELTNE